MYEGGGREIGRGGGGEVGVWTIKQYDQLRIQLPAKCSEVCVNSIEPNLFQAQVVCVCCGLADLQTCRFGREGAGLGGRVQGWGGRVQ